jgi:uncharacterized caspase-like protein
VQALAKYGRVLLLLDACHPGAVGAQGWATDPDAKVLQDAMDLENVTVLTSSKKNELSQELPDWKHGALAQAFLDALVGAADSQGIVRVSDLTDAMATDVQSLTDGRQHLGMHIKTAAASQSATPAQDGPRQTLTCLMPTAPVLRFPAPPARTWPAVPCPTASPIDAR